MIAVYGCALVLLLSLFDRFERRYAIDIGPWELLPERWCAWGWVRGLQESRRYFVMKLPSYSWEFNFSRNEYAMGHMVLLYVSERGWRTVYIFE